MTSVALTVGCTLIAFSPTASLLFILAFKKAQLVIIVTISAFAFLLSSLLAATIWNVLPNSIQSSPFILIPLGVASQCLLRLLFVHGYFKIENLIHSSIEQSRAASSAAHQTINETALFRLELNDWACGIASGIGFGGMHAIMLYGTLLSSEASNLGTLYQPSCPAVPSLVLSATNAFIFSILDILIMLISFYGMRIRRGDRENSETTIQLSGTNRFDRSQWILLSSICFHLGAALATVFNLNDDGCYVSLPLLLGTIVCCVIFFGKYVLPFYSFPRQDMEHSD